MRAPRTRRTLAASAAFFVALTGCAVPQQRAALAKCPAIVAHGAGANIAPENTAAGITASAATGVPMVEMDVRWSANNNTQGNPGYPVLMHDPTLDRTTTGTGNVDATGLTAMTKMSAADYTPWATSSLYGGFKPDGSPRTPVPYAYNFVKASADAGVDMLLDVKVTPGEWGARKLMQYVDQFGYRDRLVFMGSPAAVTAMRGWFPNLAYAVIEYPPAGRIYTGEQLRAWGAGTYAVPWDRVTPAMVTYFHTYGIKVFTWTSDRAEWDVPARWTPLAAAGVDAIITDEPVAALATFAAACSPAPSASGGN